MGLLDKLFSKEVKEKMEDLAKKINEAIDDIKDNIDKKEDEAEDVASSVTETVQEKAEEAEEFAEWVVPQLKVKRKEVFSRFEAAVGSEIEDCGSAAYFGDLIAKNLPDITVEKDVPVESLGQEVPVKRANIDLMLSKDGKQVLAVFLVPKNQYRIAKYINSMNACEDAGIPAIRFMKEFSNEPSYVIGRIKALIA